MLLVTSKKKKEEMDKQRERFLSGSLANKIDVQVAEEIFELMAKFAAYGFNKSHSAAYGLVSYQTAWLKTHYPVEFMAVGVKQGLQLKPCSIFANVANCASI